MNILKIKIILIASTLIMLIGINQTVEAQCTLAEQQHCIEIPDGGYGLTIRAEYGVTRFPHKDGVNYIRGKRLEVHTNNNFNAKFMVDEDGRVVIGAYTMVYPESKLGTKISTDDYKLFVQRGILTEKCKVAVKSTAHWSDYVFEEDYERMPIEELEEFVTENKHLPKVPSAEEMVENGLDVAKMDAKLLEKIEEAYLYIIDLNKKVDALANENEGLKTSLESLSTSNK